MECLCSNFNDKRLPIKFVDENFLGLGMFAALGKTADMQHDMTFGTANLPQKNRGKRHFVKKDFQKCSST